MVSKTRSATSRRRSPSVRRGAVCHSPSCGGSRRRFDELPRSSAMAVASRFGVRANRPPGRRGDRRDLAGRVRAADAMQHRGEISPPQMPSTPGACIGWPQDGRAQRPVPPGHREARAILEACAAPTCPAGRVGPRLCVLFDRASRMAACARSWQTRLPADLRIAEACPPTRSASPKLRAARRPTGATLKRGCPLGSRPSRSRRTICGISSSTLEQ